MRISIPQSDVVSEPVASGVRSVMGQVLLSPQQNQTPMIFLDVKEIENKTFGYEAVTIFVENDKGEESKFVVLININKRNQAEANLIATTKNGETSKKVVAHWRTTLKEVK